jgi:predicted 2-oxoglutarate/Fe(II)-dependent dioxygenase YbiX
MYNFAINNFIEDDRKKTGWNAMTNKSNEFELEIKDKLKKYIDWNKRYIEWINLTTYEINKHLPLHTDSKSSQTLVIQLNNEFTGGEFIISDSIDEEIIRMDTGDCLMFNGSKLMHGVNQVKSGIRYSLNIWTKEIHIPKHML